MHSSRTPWGRRAGRGPWKRTAGTLTAIVVAASALVGMPAVADAAPAGADAFAAASVVSAPAHPLAAGDLSVISGHVYAGAASSKPLSGIEIDVYNASNELVRDDTTDASGAYAIDPLPDGTYRVDAVDGDETYATASASVTLSGSDVAGVDLHLSPVVRYAISGTVTVKSGTTLPDSYDIELYRRASDQTWEFYDYTSPDVTTSTKYSFSAPSGYTYRVRVSAGSGYTSVTSGSFALTAAKTGVNAQLAAVVTRTITGRITGVSDPEDVTVSAWTLVDDAWEQVAFGDVAASGTYSMTVAQGTYRVAFEPGDEDHMPQVYRGISTYADPGTVSAATAVVVSSANVTGIDAPIQTAPSIRGTVSDTDGTHPAGVAVTLYEWNGADWDETDATTSDARGGYAFTGIDSGAAYVLGTDVDGVDTAGIGGYAQGATVLPSGPDAAGVGHPVAGPLTLDTTLAPAPVITGTVVDAGDSPVGGATVIVDRVEASGALTPIATRTTDVDGAYATTFRSPLASYTVRVSKPGLTTTWLGGGASAASAARLDYDDSPAAFAPATLAVAPVGLSDPDRPFCDATALPLGEAGSAAATASVSLGFTVDFYGRDYATGRLTQDGSLVLGDGPAVTGAVDLQGSAAAVLAPFSAAVATLHPSASRAGYVTYGSNGSEFCAIWHGVSASDGDAATTDSFELVLSDRSSERSDGDADILFRYGALAWDRAGADAVGWTAGTGSADATGTVHRAIVDGSGVAGALLAGGTNPLAGRELTWQIDNVESGTLLLSPQDVSVQGALEPGSTLTAHSAPWGPGDVDLAWQWTRDGQPIAGQTAATYVVQPDDRGSSLAVVVTGSRTGYANATRTSLAVRVPLGTLVPGAASLDLVDWWGIEATVEPWGPGPDAVALQYQWLRDGQPLDGETALLHELAPADRGHALSLRITGTTVAHFAPLTIETAAIIPPLLALDLTAPTVKGTATLGSKLVATRGTSSVKAAHMTFQWLRNGHTIGGATSTTYVLTKWDVGAHVTVRQTATATGYVTKALTAKSTTTVLKVFTTAPKPVIRGTAKVGTKLSVSTADWRPYGATFAFRWYANGVAIKGASTSSYTPSTTMVGKRITVQVTARKTGYATVIALSAATRAVIR